MVKKKAILCENGFDVAKDFIDQIYLILVSL
jgi:hypothetical protein